MTDIFKSFDIKELDEKKASVIMTMLSKDEQNIFFILESRDSALTPTQIYECYIDLIIENNQILKSRAINLVKVKNKKLIELKSSLIRDNNISLPTQRTITRVIENLKELGLIIKRKPLNKKAKAYYCVHPKLRLIFLQDNEFKKKKEVDYMLSKVKQLKNIIQDKK